MSLLILFQFPTNGKDFPNQTYLNGILETGFFGFNSLQTGRTFRTKLFSLETKFFSVSIPFKREGLSELTSHTSPEANKLCFNSLQTGRTFRTKKLNEGGVLCIVLSFNSLQTGRTFRTPCFFYACGRISEVSIPFKREGLSEQQDGNQVTYIYCHVSIPFKREGLSEPKHAVAYTAVHMVSIPFKREGLSERVYNKIQIKLKFNRFNSLQTGRTFRTPLPRLKVVWAIWFQFPSNGKDFPNPWVGFSGLDVSVWFQFPSNGKDFPNI